MPEIVGLNTKPEELYVCPGETHPISRSVHLSRLAAFYPKCRECPHRSETGQLPQQMVERLESTQRRVERRSLFTDEGVRGVYLNELTRSKAGKIACALASLLWEEMPLMGRLGESGSSRPQRKRSGPAVVIGHDERPSSPDIVTGVASSLRHMGCQVIDISVTTKPCFWFAVDHLQAAAGIYVTGSGCAPSWNGLDFVFRRSQPLSRGEGLDELEDRLEQPRSRPTRQAEPRRTFQATVPYQAGLWKHFHALRPLQVCYASPLRITRRTLEALFEKLPCQLHEVAIPFRSRRLDDPEDADVVRMGQAVRGKGCHLGVLIDDDGQRCAFFDEEGALISSRQITQVLAELMLSEHPGKAVVVESSATEELQETVNPMGGRLEDGGETMGQVSRVMRTEEAIFGGGDSSRFWFREAFPTCDAILTLAKILQALSRSDAPFSEVVG